VIEYQNSLSGGKNEKSERKEKMESGLAEIQARSARSARLFFQFLDRVPQVERGLSKLLHVH
jgi:hypothetical protein